MTFSLKIEPITFDNLSADELEAKITDLKSIGIRRYFMIESDDPVKTKTFAEKERNAREALNKRLVSAKRKLDLEYRNEVDAAWKEYFVAKEQAIEEMTAVDGST